MSSTTSKQEEFNAQTMRGVRQPSSGRSLKTRLMGGVRQTASGMNLTTRKWEESDNQPAGGI